MPDALSGSFIFCLILISVIHMLPGPQGFGWLTWLLTHSSPHWEVRALKANSCLHLYLELGKNSAERETEFSLDLFFTFPAVLRPRTHNSCGCLCLRGFVTPLRMTEGMATFAPGYNLGPNGGSCILRFMYRVGESLLYP